MGFCMGNFDTSVLPEAIRQSLGETGIPKYGVKFDGTNSAGVRTYDAANLLWQPSTNTVKGVDDFKSLAPFKTREVIRQWDSSTSTRKTLAYSDDPNWQQFVTAKTGERMIEFTASYYRRTSENEYIVSPKMQEGFKINPMFWHAGKMWNHFAITKYNLDSTYTSQPGLNPLVNTNMNTFRQNLKTKGLYLLDYSSYCGIVMLMLVKYANMDVQNTVANGYSSGNHTYTSGNADNVLGVDGSATSKNANEAALTLGIENFYGNVWKFMDGIFTYNGDVYMKDVSEMLQDPSSTTDLSSYTKIGTQVIKNANSAQIKNIAYDLSYDYLLYPTVTGTPCPSNDNCWANTPLDCVLVGGSAWSGSSSSGLLAFLSAYAVGVVAADCGGCATEYYD